MNLKKTKHQLTWLNRHEPELTVLARSEYWKKGRGLLMVFADRIVNGQPQYGYLTSEQVAGMVGADWETSGERAAIETYDPELVSIVQFVWMDRGTCGTRLFVLRATV